MPIATRLTNAGTLLVNGSFDENTSIAPSTFRTTSTTVQASALDEASLTAGAITFNGTSQYLTVPDSASQRVGTSSFTIEAWVFVTITDTNPIYSKGADSTEGIYFGVQNSTNLAEFQQANTDLIVATTAVVLNQWTHIAVSRNGTSLRLFINGILQGTVTNSTNFSQTAAGRIGRGRGTSTNYWRGRISNFRLVIGTAVYTASFTPPQYILPAVTNTQLLVNVTTAANFIQDNSINRVTLTNNGTATWTAVGPFNQGSTTLKQRQLNDGTQEVYTQFDEFTGAPVVNTNLMVWVDAAQTASYSGSGATWTDLSGNGKTYTLSNSPTFSSTTGGGVITFAGASSQYATTASTLFNSTTTNTYSINIWVYPTGAGQIVSVDGQSTPNSGYHYTAIEITAAGLIYFGQWTGAMTTIITSAQSLNAWYNLAITYNGTTATAYVNGASVGSSAIAWSAPGANTFFALMSQDATNMSGTTAYASGSIGAFMVYNRALIADEVTTNFNALRGRYGV